jgi:hypothetical protein
MMGAMDTPGLAARKHHINAPYSQSAKPGLSMQTKPNDAHKTVRSISSISSISSTESTSAKETRGTAAKGEMFR